MGRSEVSTSVLKWSVGLSKGVSITIRRYIDIWNLLLIWLLLSSHSFIFSSFYCVSFLITGDAVTNCNALTVISSVYSKGNRRHISPEKMWIVELRLTSGGGNIDPSVPSMRLHSSPLQHRMRSSPLNRVITPSLFTSCFPVFIVIRSFVVLFCWKGKLHLKYSLN